MYNFPRPSEHYEKYFSELVKQRSSNFEWLNSPTPSCIYIPNTRFLVTNNTLRERPVAGDVIDGIVDYINRELNSISDDFINLNFHDFNIIVGDGYIIKGRIFRVSDKQAIFNSELGEDELATLTVGVCVYFNDLTDQATEVALHLDHLRNDLTGEFVFEYKDDELFFLISKGFLTSLGKVKGDRIFIEDLVYEPDLEKTRAAVLFAIENGENDFETRILGEEGEPIWVAVHLRVERQTKDKGQIVGFVKNIEKEITERRRAIEKANQLEIALELLSGVFYSVDFNEEGNPKFIRIADFDPEDIPLNLEEGEFINLDPFFKMIHPEDRDSVIETFKKIKDGLPLQIKLRIITADGDTKYVENYVIPTFDEDGIVNGAIGGFIDVTDIVSSQSFENVIDQLSILVHDLKSPISTIKLSISLLQRKEVVDSAEKRNQYLNSISEALKQMNDAIETMLLIARAQRDDSIKNREIFDSMRLIDDCIKEAHVTHRTIDIHSNGDQLIIHTNYILIKHVLINFLSNANKYSPLDKSIDIYFSDEEDTISISIRDYGMGIPLEDQEAIFNNYKRARNSKEIDGSGVGLVKVKKIAQSLGCKVSFHSAGKDGEGCTFTVTIPKPSSISINEP